MNISATRKVSGSSSSRSAGHSNNKVSSVYYAPAEEEYVENIDVSNKVSVKEDSHEQIHNPKEPSMKTFILDAVCCAVRWKN